MTNKDIIFWSLLTIFFLVGIYVAFYTNFNVWKYNTIIISIFSILCLLKKFNKKFNNWLERKI